MLGIILSSNYVYYVMGVIFTAGIIIKAITGGRLNRLEKEAREMNKSTSPFLKLVKAKFEHAFMANGKVDNIDVFVDKFMREYRICGLSAHVWGRVKLFLAILLILLGVMSSARTYSMGRYTGSYIEPGIVALILSVLMIGTYYVVDEKYRLHTIKIYMVDHLENVMSKRLEKTYVKNTVAAIESEAQEAVKNQENAIIETTTEMFEIEEEKYQSSTAGITLKQVKENQDTKKLPNIENVYAAAKEVEKEIKEESINAAVLREILQEFLA